jgi:hypothetical protein
VVLHARHPHYKIRPIGAFKDRLCAGIPRQRLRIMKAFLLAVCLAAIATSASARPWAAFYCGKLQVALIPSKYFDPSREACDPCDGKTHYFVMKKDPDRKRPLSNRLFRNSDDSLFYKGNKCREFTEKDYDTLN